MEVCIANYERVQVVMDSVFKECITKIVVDTVSYLTKNVQDDLNTTIVFSKD